MLEVAPGRNKGGRAGETSICIASSTYASTTGGNGIEIVEEDVGVPK